MGFPEIWSSMIKISKGVNITGFVPEMHKVFGVVALGFSKHGHDCWLTSGFRPGDPRLHGKGAAADFDSSRRVSYETGMKIRGYVKRRLGRHYDVIWHRVKRKDGSYGAWHLHVEYDPKD